MMGMKAAPWEECSLKELQTRLFEISKTKDKLKFKLKVTNCPNFTIWLDPLPFVAENKNEEDITIRFELCTYEKIAEIAECYPAVVDNKIEGKEIDYIQAHSCPCTYEYLDVPNKVKCRHNVFIFFKNGTHIMYFGGGPEISVKLLQEKGYIPFIKQYRPKSDAKYKLQMEKCELSKLLDITKIIKCPHD
jgi:hypothetical protein